jgi:hypothetical protein
MVSYSAKVMGLPKRFGGPSWNRPVLRWTIEAIQLLTVRATEGWPLETIRRELSHRCGVVFTRAAFEKMAKQLGLTIHDVGTTRQGRAQNRLRGMGEGFSGAIMRLAKAEVKGLNASCGARSRSLLQRALHDRGVFGMTNGAISPEASRQHG